MADEVMSQGASAAAPTEEAPPARPADIVWLSTVKAAARLGVTPRTLYRFIDKGELPAYRFGRVIRLRLTDVDKYIDECLVTPGTLDHLYPDGRPQKDQPAQ